MLNQCKTAILGFALLLTFTQCGSSFSDEIQHVSDMENRLEKNKENLDVDVELFKSRIAHIQETLRIFSNDYPDTMSLELGNQLSRWKGLKKIYNQRVGQFENNRKEQVELEKQLSNLKNDLENSAITKEEFRNYIQTENADLERLITSSKEVKTAFYEIEPEYIRISGLLDKELQKIQVPKPLP